MKIYTRTGDAGETSLFGGSRVAKDDPRIEAYGTVDELSSFIGVARAAWPEGRIDDELARVQSDLFDIGAQLAAPGSSFILPGGSVPASHLHVARTVCRRAERRVVSLQDDATRTTVVYLNRLSDFLFVAARYANLKHGVADVPWRSS